MKERNEESKTFIYRSISDLHANGLISMHAGDGVDFLNEFATLVVEAKGKNVVHEGKFNDLVRRLGLDGPGLMWLVRCLLQYNEEDKILGKKLLFTLSATGSEEATIRIMSHALLGHSKAQPNTLRSSEILYARGHLREIARRGHNYRAMVLEGKIAYELGDDGYAIQMWEQAMDAAVAVAELDARLQAEGKFAELRALRREVERDLSELSTPWIELTLIHYERYVKHWQRNEAVLALAGLEAARKANKIGCAQDDPTSHYHAAEFFKDYSADGSTKHTSSWLYHMTKAGATGHVKAAHALAEFYSTSGWKYIEDEPPDHIKPTPFDSYPAPSSETDTASSSGSWWQRLFGLDVSKAAPTSAEESMFHTAAFPPTPSGRWKLAARWLESATAYHYAPSHLLGAKMLLEKSMWGQARAPAAALELSPDRYTYASKSHAEAKIPLAGEPEVDPPDEPNPLYNPAAARNWLQQIFYAAVALKMREQRIKGTKAEAAAADDMLESVHWHFSKWLKYPDVREMWEGDIEKMLKEAMEICDREGWDMYDEEGGLLYKAGARRRSEAQAARSAAAG